jgi:membrane-associated protease RseP (regulator of RpoE activity)
LWLHVSLFVLTLFTTSVVGARMQQNFQANLPFFDVSRDLDAFTYWWRHPGSIVAGLPFSLTLMAILLAHEFGHYFACRYYGVSASLPYFLPWPFTGTLGAFIRIREPIYYKKVLFDIGIAGPLAGFIFLLPALSIGIAYSKELSGIAHEGTFRFGTPALEWLMTKAIFPGVGEQDLYLHPVGRAAWVGMCATALNLLPIGQLDGGHILYSFVGDRHRRLSRLFALLLVPLGLIYWEGWLLWAVVLFFFGRHPSLFDPAGLGSGRRKLGFVALAIFLMCFTLAPIKPS